MDEISPDPTVPPPNAAPAQTAGDLASEALSSAQAAVSTLRADAGAPGGTTDAISAAEAAIAQARVTNAPSAPAGPSPLHLPGIVPGLVGAAREAIGLLADVNLHVKIELGRTRMLVEDVLRLGEGSVVELDKLAGDPVDVYVNDRPVARGEVLVLNDNFCVRINEIITQAGDTR